METELYLELYCPKCRMELSEGYYCCECGTGLTQTPDYCSHCDYWPTASSAITDKFCRGCGASRAPKVLAMPSPQTKEVEFQEGA